MKKIKTGKREPVKPAMRRRKKSDDDPPMEIPRGHKVPNRWVTVVLSEASTYVDEARRISFRAGVPRTISEAKHGIEAVREYRTSPRFRVIGGS